MSKEVERLQELIDQYDNIVFFGGAGVSTESGIPDFRSQDGLYNQKYDYPPETILSHTFFMGHPEEFYRFYQDKMLCDTAKPNAAHLKLAELEEAGKLKAVITQNIDNLHQMAGSKHVLELHGSVYRNYCMRCGKSYDFKYMKAAEGVPRLSLIHIFYGYFNNRVTRAAGLAGFRSGQRTYHVRNRFSAHLIKEFCILCRILFYIVQEKRYGYQAGWKQKPW